MRFAADAVFRPKICGRLQALSRVFERRALARSTAVRIVAGELAGGMFVGVTLVDADRPFVSRPAGRDRSSPPMRRKARYHHEMF